MTSESLVTRVVPPISTRWRGRYLVERNYMTTKAYWPVVASGFFEPIFYLFAIGVGIGQLVGDVVASDGSMVSYAAFVAPAMLASSAMNGAIFESTNMFFKLKYGKTYDGILATPMQPVDVASGEIAWSLIRGGTYSLVFIIVMAAMGLVDSWWGLLALPAAVLIGFSFAAVGTAAATYMRTWQDLDLVALVTLPLFLFSATFYPIDVYPKAIQVLTWFSPLFHGVRLVRGLTLGMLDWTMLINMAFLITMGAIGAVITSRRIGSLLLK
ncbi:MAG: ABC transporter permease [Acidimicrobiia bacterium]|nr:MAG: ABC transporter permease [Acidimicrobiia bacterium]